MTLRPAALLITLLTLTLAVGAPAAELARDKLLLPLAPGTTQRVLHVSAQGLDPAKPVWVKFELATLSAADPPTGELVLDAMPLEQRVPLGQSVVRFEAARMSKVKGPSPAELQQIETALARLSPQEQEERLGSALLEALQAVRNGRGSMLQGTQVRQVEAPGKTEMTFSTSVARTQGLQPFAIQVTLGQGEPPVSEAERERAYRKDKVWAAAFGLLFVLGFWWWRRRREA